LDLGDLLFVGNVALDIAERGAGAQYQKAGEKTGAKTES
jgi:hypothetical protein